MLAEHFIQQLIAEQGMPPKSFSEDALEALKAIRWTGNIRELRNVIERLAILCDKVITGDDVNTFAQPLSAVRK